MFSVWQHPYVNVFKHFKVEEWKKSTKEGDVTTVMPFSLLCWHQPLHFPPSLFLLIPFSLMRSPLCWHWPILHFPGMSLLTHTPLSRNDSQVIRVSFSNLFKEFKSTATWLQFPFICGAAKGSVYETTSSTAKQGLVGPAPASVRWTCLMLDLHYILSVYLSRRYSHLKSLKLCSSLTVKNLFTSDILFDPSVTFSKAKQTGMLCHGTAPLPREMAFPVRKGDSWHDLYDCIRFPSDGSKMPFDSIQKGHPDPKAGNQGIARQVSPTREYPRIVSISKPVQDRLSLIQQITSPRKRPRQTPLVTKSIPEVRLATSLPRKEEEEGTSDEGLDTADDGGIHVFAHRDEEVTIHRHSSDTEETVCTRVSGPATLPGSLPSCFKLQPDPILKLKKIIGFGGCTTRCAVWTKTGSEVVYPCHAVIVAMEIRTGHQRFFIGHTDKVSALAFNGNATLLASAQTGSLSMVRVWNFLTSSCLAMFKTHVHSVSSLSFSYSSGVLCGVGKDGHGKSMVVVWNTSRITKAGEVVVMAKAHTDVDIQVMKIAFFDDTRMVSCGRDNIRLWRVRSGSLRSCPVNLGEYHTLEFTDVAFEEGHLPDREPEDRLLFACSKSGHILEVDYKNVVLKNVRRLLPSQLKHSQRREKQTFKSGPGIAINSISVSSAFCATGSDDGYLRLWPLDFSAVFLEAEHEGAVSLVNICPDGLKVLAATTTGNLGYLEIASRGYTTLMRSHTDSILGFSSDGIRRHLATVSQDGTIRIWDLNSMQQLYDFTALDETPCTLAFHPTLQVFACGFSSGVVRVFNVAKSALLAEHKQHRGGVTGLAFSQDGDYMYSAGSLGSLALYNSAEEDHHILRVLGNVVARGNERAPDALTVSTDSRYLAFVGPSEYTVTVMDGRSLDELLRIDVSILDLDSTSLDSATKVCYAPASIGQLLVTTSANKLLWLNNKTGRLVREVSRVHRNVCSSLAVSNDSRFLLTAGDRLIKVWDYHMKHDVSFQVYIGHSESVRQVKFTSDQLSVVSIGDAVFIWDFLAYPRNNFSSLSCFLRGRTPFAPRSSPTAGVHSEARLNQLFVTNGFPRQSVPRPFTSSPPRLDISSVSRTERDEFLSESDDREDIANISAVKDSSVHITANLGSRTDASEAMIIHSRQQREAELRGSGNGAESREELDGQTPSPIRPDSYRHFLARFKTTAFPKTFHPPAGGEEWLKLRAVIGYNGNGRGNMVWNPDTGFFAYSCGCIVVVEDLHSGSQKHWLEHTEEISTLTVTNDAQVLASASGGGRESRSRICVWNVADGILRKVLSHHETEVQAMAYSRDDHFFLTAGDYRDLTITLWDTRNYKALVVTRLTEPIHDVAFNPSSAWEFACVGKKNIMFWLIDQQGYDVHLKVHKVPVPEEMGSVELTSLCYNTISMLYTGTNTGRICVWDLEKNCCFVTWEADQGEIGVLLCRGNRLLSGSNTRKIRLWAVAAVQGMRLQGSTSRSSSVLVEHEMTLDGTIVSAAFDEVMDMGIVGTTAGTLWYINWAENTSIRLISGHKNKVNEVVFSPDKCHFATCAEDGSVRVWTLNSTELAVQFQVLNQSCLCMAWRPSLPGQLHAESQRIVAGYSDGTIRVFGVLTTEMELKMHPHPVAVTAIAYSTDVQGEVILSGGMDGLMAVSSPRTGMTIRIISDHKSSTITAIQCTQKQYNEFGLPGCDLWLAVSLDRQVSVWAADWLKDKCEIIDWLAFPVPAELEVSDAAPPSVAAFSPSEHGVVICSGFGVTKEIVFYGLQERQVIKKIALSHWATCLSTSPRGHLLAIGTNERLLQLLDTSNESFQDLAGHDDRVHFSKFSPCGQLLFTVTYNEILVWEVPQK
uniref:WD repeat domain 90 n=1 Tax=Latimeria chalumnae TaxID=7897 RepID=H2ZYH0_LATCH